MLPSIQQFFELLRTQVTEEDIRTYSPNDPGYPEYVSLWSNILQKGAVQDTTSFQLSEVISLTGYAKPENYADPNRFRTYRLFTLVVACHLLAEGNDSDCVWPVNYTAIRLIDDAQGLAEAQILAVVGNLLAKLAAKLKILSHPEVEYPFLCAAEMIWAQRQGDFPRSVEAAAKLLREEQAVRQLEGNRFDDGTFLFGLTNYRQLEEAWSQAISELKNPHGNEHLELAIEALRDGCQY